MLNFRTILPALGLGLLAVAAGCAGDDVGSQAGHAIDWDDPSAGPEGRWPGQTIFESAAPWSHIWRPWMRTLADGPSILENARSPERAIEEGDIVKTDGDRAFVLNPYRGLMSIDITFVDNPSLKGRLPMQGQPQEMYIRGNTALVLMNGVYTWDAEQDYRSSLLVVDVSNMSSPKLITEHRVDGNVLESRVVGDALYVVSDEWDSETREQTTHVFSLDIS